MYFVVNRTKKAVEIADMNLVIAPRRGVDLETLRSKDKVAKSQDLRRLLRCGMLELRSPSKGKKKKTEAASASSVELKEIKDEMKELKEAIKSLGSGNSSPELTAVLAQLVSTMQNPPAQTIIKEIHHAAGSAGPDMVDDTPDLDEETLTNIHARAVEKMVRNTEGKVNYKEQKIQDSASARADELDGLLD